MLVDTHCHLDFHRFNDDRDAVVSRAAEAGVTRILVPAVDPENWTAVLHLAEQYDGVYAAVGVHPNATADWQDGWIDQLGQLAQHPKVVAIGEIGLDYYWKKSPKEVQHRALRRQLELAAELHLPVIIHNRESDADVVRLLAESPLNGQENPGVLHSFLAKQEMAQEVLELGFYLGFTGPVTHDSSKHLHRLIARMPLERILVETDAPYLAPKGHKGERNEPAFVAEVAEKIAQIRGLETAVLAQHTTENALRLFKRMNEIE